MNKAQYRFAGISLYVAGPLLSMAVVVYAVSRPRAYVATAVIRAQFPAAASQANDRVGAGELLTTPVLGAVADRLRLAETWAAAGGDPLDPGETLPLLRESIRVRPQTGDAGVLEVQVRRADPRETAQIANALVAALRSADETLAAGALEVQVVKPAAVPDKPAPLNLLPPIFAALAFSVVSCLAGTWFMVLGFRQAAG